MDEDRQGRSRYWLWSLLVHTVALLLLIFCTPVREVIFEKENKPKAEITMSGEDLKKVIEKIRDSEEDILRERVALLGFGVDRIRVNLLNKQRHNRGFEDAQRTAAYDRVLTAMRGAIQALDAKIALHQRNVGKDYNPDDAAEIQKRDVIARGFQDDIEAALPLLPDVPGLADLIAKQKEASDAHSLASNFSRWTFGAAGGVRKTTQDLAHWTAEVATATKARDDAKAAVAEAGPALTKAEEALVAADKTLTESEAAAKAADQAHRATKEEAAKITAKEALDAAKAARDHAKKHRDQARKDRDLAKKAAADAQRSLDKEEKTLADRSAKLAQATEQLPKAVAEREKKDGELTWHTQHARNQEQAILEAYQQLFTSEAVQEHLAREREAKPMILGPDGKPPLVIQADEPANDRDELMAAGLADLFDISDRYIAQAVTDYRALKAIELARLRDLALATALEQIAPLDPLPTQVDTDLLRADITDPDLVEPHKQEILKVKASVEEKIALVEKLILELEQQQMEMAHTDMQMEPQTLEDLIQQEIFDEAAEAEATDAAAQLMEQLSYEEKRELLNEHMEALTQVAQEDAQQKMKDLTALMKQNPLAQQQQSQQENQEQKDGKDGKEPPPPPPSLAGKKGLEVGAPPPLNLTPNTPGILARKITDTGSPSEWMYVDTWYTIGPFGNEGRRNLNTKFPPETVVDLQAKYVGKGGQQIRWTFMQSRGTMSVPADDQEYAIYYAYTEIFSDRPRDVWIAVGSDDKANVWINDMPVWISGDALKGWNISEGYRKVHLVQGVNKVLYRIENGWRATAFSLSIHTKRDGL